MIRNTKHIHKSLRIKHNKHQFAKKRLVQQRSILKYKKSGILARKSNFFLLKRLYTKLKGRSYNNKLVRLMTNPHLAYRRSAGFLVNRKAFRRLLMRTYFRYFLSPSRKNKIRKYGLFTRYTLNFRKTKNKLVLFKRAFRGKIRTRLFIKGFFFFIRAKLLASKKIKKAKKLPKLFFPGKFRRNFNKSPFQKLEKFSFFKLFGYIKPKRRGYLRKNIKKSRINYKGYSKRTVNFSKKRFKVGRRNRIARTKKKPKNLVFKNKVWCVQVKKSDGRLIYRPLKLSDFLSSRSGWRTRTTSFKKRISKSNKPLLFMRFILRSRNEYDSFVFKKRKIYSYYKKIYKYIEWKFRHYRTLFKKYSLSRHKYTSFRSIPNQFAWNILSSRVIQAKSSNLGDSFSNSLQYLLVANSPLLWQLAQTTFVNGALPSSFYNQYRVGRNDGVLFQNRPYLYNWNKKYKVAYSKNTKLNHQFQKPPGVHSISPLIFKSSSMFPWHNLRFASLISNRQRHFTR